MGHRWQIPGLEGKKNSSRYLPIEKEEDQEGGRDWTVLRSNNTCDFGEKDTIGGSVLRNDICALERTL